MSRCVTVPRSRGYILPWRRNTAWNLHAQGRINAEQRNFNTQTRNEILAAQQPKPKIYPVQAPIRPTTEPQPKPHDHPEIKENADAIDKWVKGMVKIVKTQQDNSDRIDENTKAIEALKQNMGDMVAIVTTNQTSIVNINQRVVMLEQVKPQDIDQLKKEIEDLKARPTGFFRQALNHDGTPYIDKKGKLAKVWVELGKTLQVRPVPVPLPTRD